MIHKNKFESFSNIYLMFNLNTHSVKYYSVCLFVRVFVHVSCMQMMKEEIEMFLYNQTNVLLN